MNRLTIHHCSKSKNLRSYSQHIARAFDDDRDLTTTLQVGIDGMITIQVDGAIVLTVVDPLPSIQDVVDAVKSHLANVRSGP